MVVGGLDHEADGCVDAVLCVDEILQFDDFFLLRQ